MSGQDLLFSTFLKEAKKQGLGEGFITEIFDELKRSQYIPAGDRDMIRARLLKIIQKGD